MKLSDFGNRSKSSSRRQPKIVLENVASEKRLLAQIDELNQELGKYRTIEAERDAAMQRRTVLEEEITLVRTELSLVDEKIDGLNEQIKYLEEQNSKIPDLEDVSRDAKGQLSSTKNELDLMTKKALGQSQELNTLQVKLKATISDNQILTTENIAATRAKIDITAEKEALKTANEEFKSFTDETSKINKKLVEQTKDLKDQVNYWEVESKELLVQIEESKLVETKLREWVSNLETETSESNTSKSALGIEVSTLKLTISDMSKTLSDMVKEMTYLRLTNREYRKELSKPRFMSMGAIMKSENFTMPQGKENIRTHNLGNAAPTLLKFKTQKEDSDAR